MTTAAERVQRWIEVYESNPGPRVSGDRLAVSFEDAPLLLSDLRALLPEKSTDLREPAPEDPDGARAPSWNAATGSAGPLSRGKEAATRPPAPVRTLGRGVAVSVGGPHRVREDDSGRGGSTVNGTTAVLDSCDRCGRKFTPGEDAFLHENEIHHRRIEVKGERALFIDVHRTFLLCETCEEKQQ